MSVPKKSANPTGGLLAVLFGAIWLAVSIPFARHSHYPVIGVISPVFGAGFLLSGIINVVNKLRRRAPKDEPPTEG